MEIPPEVVRERAEWLVAHDFAALRDRYLAENGAVLDSDRAKELFPDYSMSIENRRRFSSAVYASAAHFIDRLYEELLPRRVPSEKQRLVVCTAGGPGSGKSALVITAQDVFQSAALVLDGTFSNPDRAGHQITLALAMDYRVQILLVYRPLQECLRGVWDRALSNFSARATPFRIVIEKHDGSLTTIRKLRLQYQNHPRVSFLCYRFTQPDQPALGMTWSELDGIPAIDLATSVKMAQAVLHECENLTPHGRRLEAESLRTILAEGLG